MLVVDDFEIKYAIEEHATHLLITLQQDYIMDIEWSGKQKEC